MNRNWATASVALLLLLACGEQAVLWWTSQRTPRKNDYAALREPVARLREPNEPVVVEPSWAEPWVRWALGPELMPIELLARPEPGATPSVMTISLSGQHPEAYADWRRQELEAVGPFQLARYRDPEHRPVLFDFVSGLSPERVEVLSAGARCPFRKDARLSSGGLGGHPTFARSRFQCSGGEFFHVGRTTIADETFAPRRCLWAHPPGRGELSIRFRDVPLGEQLVGHGGMYWIVERERAGAPVQLSVHIDGDEVGRVFHADGDGWARFSVSLGEHAGKSRAMVEWRISSPDHRHRHYCFEARSL